MQQTKRLLSCAFIFLMALYFTPLKGQETLSSDELFVKARHTAFEQKNYSAAIGLCRQALEISPAYTDIRVFLGRLFFWNDQTDSARQTLDRALLENSSHEDAAIAAASIAYFSDRYIAALDYSEKGLQYHPQSEELRLQKAKSLSALKRYPEALLVVDSLLAKNPTLTTARELLGKIKEYRAKNSIAISYDFTHFAKQFDKPWHLLSVDYSRQTGIGSITGRVNYGNRFGESGVQFEVDAYPHIAKGLYAYVNVGYSPDLPIFPKFRSGFSLYANLPKSFEADAGFRYLRFSENTWIYTGSIGKYWKNWWFNCRAYITPDDARISQSYSLTARYYRGGADDYLSVSIGSGLSPDERNQAILLNSNYKLVTRKASAAYKFSYKKLNIFSMGVSYANVEYLPKTRDNQITAGVSYQRRF